MPYKYNKPTRIIITTMLCFSISSCKKFIEIPAPDTQVLSNSLFTNDQTATAAMSGLYTRIIRSDNTIFNGALTIYPGLSSDELIKTPNSTTFSVFTENAIPVNNAITREIWAAAYTYIYNANAILEGVSGSTGMSAPIKSQFRGEAKFLRAFSYFYLLHLFGAVPLIVDTEYEKNATVGRTGVIEIYKQILNDLHDAEKLLLSDYVITPSFPNARVRPNKWTATSLLARTYLYLQDWQNAEKHSSLVINSGLYSLAPINNAFKSASMEAIWQLMPVGSLYNTYEGNRFVPASNAVVPNFSLAPSLLHAFEPGDLRKVSWTGTNTISSQQYTYPFKYKVRTGGAPYSEYYIVFRLAEQYLIRGEARAHQNNLPEAIRDLNTIRTRAGLPFLPQTLTRTETLNRIQQERRIELLAEWGHRWFDLKRTNRADTVLAALKGSSWQSTDMLYPIPVNQILNNPNLSQNPGY